jgi:hypothetical protein
MKSEPDTAASIIRTGTDGRLCFAPQQREAMLDAFAASGQSALAFSKEHDRFPGRRAAIPPPGVS